MNRVVVVLALLLVGCSSISSVLNGGATPPPSNGAPSPPVAWTLWFSPGVSLAAGPSFSFPQWNASACPGPTGFSQTCPSVHYLVNKSGAINSSQSFAMTVTVAGNAPQWNYANIENDGNTCTSPATVRFYFQETGDNWSGIGGYAYYRWWSTQAIVLQPGISSLTVPLAPANWSSVEGENGANSATATAAFNAAMANARTIGMTFGGGCFYGHGVDLTGGSATFTLNSYTVH